MRLFEKEPKFFRGSLKDLDITRLVGYGIRAIILAGLLEWFGVGETMTTVCLLLLFALPVINYIALTATNPNIYMAHSCYRDEVTPIRENGFNPPHAERESGIEDSDYLIPMQRGRDVVSFGIHNHSAFEAMRRHMGQESKDYSGTVTMRIIVPWDRIVSVLPVNSYVVFMGMVCESYGMGVEALVQRSYINTRVEELKVGNCANKNNYLVVMSVVLDCILKPRLVKIMVYRFMDVYRSLQKTNTNP